jgi:hypothetical protein
MSWRRHVHRLLPFALTATWAWGTSCAKVERVTPGAATGGGGASATTNADAAPVDTSVDGPTGRDLGATDRGAGADRAPLPEAGGGPADAAGPDAPGGGRADAACAMQTATAETLPLDLFMMMDSSGSMTEQTAAGPTKWQAVETAMGAFFNDPMSAGIDVELQYFPLIQPNARTTCTTNADCGAYGPCDLYRTCFGLTTTQIVLCTTQSDCQPGEACVELGSCPVSGGSCAPIGVYCPYGDVCTPQAGYCHGRDRCDAPAYATPAVPLAALTGAAAALSAALAAHQPDGRTPTGPALSGALQAAATHAATTPDRKSAVVLVTDGLPTECTPDDIPGIAGIAASGLAGSPPIPTFVIGVFGPDEAAMAGPNLDALAAGGGTGRAVVIDTSQDVTKALQSALDAIRTTAVACTYKIPPPTTGTIDFNKVNVEVTAGNGTQSSVGYVHGKASCDPTRGGWYYDADPAAGGTPTSIIACDATCAQLKSDAATRVDIVLGCQTIVITFEDPGAQRAGSSSEVVAPVASE